MKRTLLSLILAALLLLSGCKAGQEVPASGERYQASFLTLFDTVTTIIGYAESKEAFTAQAQQIHDDLLIYHQLFDIYNTYPDIQNLKTVNDNAGIAPVQVDRKLIDLLLFCREIYDSTDGRVNAAMGSVLSLWHACRTEGIDDPESARLPEEAALKQAAEHTDFDAVCIDPEAGTVFISDPLTRLDVGAVAKGYAVEQVCRSAPKGLLISVGGNVCATGPRPDGTAWVVGIQNPNGGDNLHTLRITGGSVVTSGDYQRYYTVDGKQYHHIIDPDTGMPGTYWRSVTILCDDSGLADGLSTALFLLPQEEGQKLLDRFGAQAMWVDAEGNEYLSPGFSDYIRT